MHKIILAATAATVIAVPLATAQGDTTRTFSVKEGKDIANTFVSGGSQHGRGALAAGDRFSFVTPTTGLDGAPDGKIYATCDVLLGNKHFAKATMACTGLAEDSQGTISFAFKLVPSHDPVVAAITGGTGVYNGATGTITSKSAKGGDIDTISIS